MNLYPDPNEVDFSDCPYCGDSEIVAGDVDFEGESVGVKVTCQTCDKTWWEVYVASHREEYHDGPFPVVPIPHKERL